MSAESRQSTRFLYPHRQLIAPVLDGARPGAEGLVEVLFHDLSSCGFSFYIAEPLDCERIVAQLGAPPEAVHVLARWFTSND